MTAHKSLTELIDQRGGSQFAEDWPYAVQFPDGTIRYAVGKSPKDAAAKVCQARRCTKDEIIEAAFGLINGGKK